MPYGPIKVETSATALHYGISVFEGLNIVENRHTGKLQGFRVHDHLKALNDSSSHLDMPTFCTEEFIQCFKQLVVMDKDWIQVEDDLDQFYARILHFSTDKTLGVRTAQSTKLIAMLNPIRLKPRPISLKCSVGVNKNWPLGHGQHRLSGNLGPLIPTVAEARENGFDDVLWLLDGNITEMTIQNVFVLWMSRYG
jgi:branched-chain amino acid aminotransferase